jgi:hypothetical protein
MNMVDTNLSGINVDNYQSLATSTCLVELNISQPQITREDKEATQKIAELFKLTLHDVNGKPIKPAAVHKKLYEGWKEYAKLKSFIGFSRREHERLTVPWSNSGLRMVTTLGYPDYVETMTGYQEQMESMLDNDMRQTYPDAMRELANVFGDMHDPSLYYDWDTFRSKYRFSIRTWGTPDVSDVRVSLPQQALEDMKADMQSAIQESALKANQDMWKRTHKVLDRLSKGLGYKEDGKLQTFKDTFVPAAQELVTQLRALNITNDAKMVEAANKLEYAFKDKTNESLREEGYERDETKSVVDQVLASIPSLDI